MFTFDFANNKVFASVFAIGASALLMAMAIVPATPAGMFA